MTLLGALFFYLIIGSILMRRKAHEISMEAAQTGEPPAAVAFRYVLTWPWRR